MIRDVVCVLAIIYLFTFEHMENALHGAAVLASHLWLASPLGPDYLTVDVFYDPELSTTAENFTSWGHTYFDAFCSLSVIALDLVFCIIISSTQTPTLDSFPMIGLGAKHDIVLSVIGNRSVRGL